MTITANWGPDFASVDGGRFQDAVALVDFLTTDGNVEFVDFSATRMVLTGVFRGERISIVIDGSGFTLSGDDLGRTGIVDRITFYDGTSTTASNVIFTLDGPIDGAALITAIQIDNDRIDNRAIEDFFLNERWVYNGTDLDDRIDSTIRSGDNFPIKFDGGGEFNLAGGNDVFQSGDGRDTISGGGGNDYLAGGFGADLIRGNKQEDTLLGGAGDDKLFGQANGDLLNGGTGRDRLNGGGGNDTLRGGANNDFLKGGSRKDNMDGGPGNDRLFGNSFDDTLKGGAGDDTLNAGGEDDRLIGGKGDDDLKGGPGSDTFVFSGSHGQDRIRDFDATDDDEVIDLSGVNGFTSFQNVADAASQQGEDVLIDTGNGNSILLLDVSLGDLDSADFSF